MSEEVLPMKYLAIPLSSKNLTHEDYSLFIKKVCGKITGWQARHLSLGGKARLVSLPLLMKQMCGFGGIHQMVSSHKSVSGRSLGIKRGNFLGGSGYGVDQLELKFKGVLIGSNDNSGNRKNKAAFLAKELKVIELANELDGSHVVTLHPY
ncbi:hypothetical protein LIER_22751 [Lithospermum erythrorhizon]|uniref:Uncharacterized protein n=1 Tax=Lithospermum erythrorhizon TaxID=34254 RepID=A0AAV3QY41_LITER